ncbi:hypothetical protein YC2023_104711 [Brassica napus]
MGDNGVFPSTLSSFQLQLSAFFLPTVFCYIACILGSKLFKTSIVTVLAVLVILLGQHKSVLVTTRIQLSKGVTIELVVSIYPFEHEPITLKYQICGFASNFNIFMQEHFVSFLVPIAITWFTLHIIPERLGEDIYTRWFTPYFNRKTKNLIPGPRGVPLVGSMSLHA